MKKAFDEMWGDWGGEDPRGPYVNFAAWLEDISNEDLNLRKQAAEHIFRKTGITFAVYSNEEAEERIIPVSYTHIDVYKRQNL